MVMGSRMPGKGIYKDSQKDFRHNIGEADYIITKDRNYTIAVDGKTKTEQMRDTDASTVIQYAIDQLTNGGKVFIKNGTYDLSAMLDIKGKDNIVIEGESWKAELKPTGDTKIMRIGDRTNAVAGGDHPSSNCRITNLYFNGTNQTSDDVCANVSGDAATGIEVAGKNSRHNTIDHNYFYDTANDSIYGQYSGDILVEGNLVKDNRGYWGGIHFHGGFTDRVVIVAHNTIINAAPCAIRHGTILIGNNILGIAIAAHGPPALDSQFGINGPASTGPTIGGLVCGNYLSSINSTHTGIRTHEPECAITGNYVHGFQDGIEAHHDDVTITGNVCHTCDRIALLIKFCDHVTCCNNTVIDAQGKGGSFGAVQISNTAKDVIVANNTIRNAAADKPDYIYKIFANTEEDIIIRDNTEEGYDTGILLNNGIRTVYNGVSDNAGVPGVAGDWVAATKNGVMVRDTTNNKTYIYAGGGWREISAV